MRVAGTETHTPDRRLGAARRSHLFTAVTGASLLAIASMAASAPSARALERGVQEGARTVWNGSYTEAQAARGREGYLKACGSCHADNLQGGDEAPGLVGAGFLSQWLDLSVGDLFERTRRTGLAN